MFLKFISFTIVVFYAILIFLYSEKFLELKIRKNSFYGLVIILASFFWYLNYQRIPYPYLYMMMYITLLLLYKFCFEGSSDAKLFASGNFVFHLLCLKGMSVSVFAIVSGNSVYTILNNEGQNQYLLLVVYVLACICLCFFQKIYRIEYVNLLIKTKKRLKLLIEIEMLLNLALLIISFITDSNISGSVGNNLYHFILCIIILIGFYVLFQNEVLGCISKIKGEDIVTLEKQMEKQIQFHERQNEYIKILRTLKHDYKNQIMGLGFLLQKHEVDEAIAYVYEINNMIYDIDSDYQQFSNHVLADAILQDINTQCKNEGIQFKAILKIFHLPLSNLQLCTILSNVMNNAIEACLKEEGDERFIEVESNIKGKWFAMKISNSFHGEIKLKDNQIISSKEDKANHGIGLLSVRSIVEEYLGIVNIQNDQNVFTVTIMLPLNNV